MKGSTQVKSHLNASTAENVSPSPPRRKAIWWLILTSNCYEFYFARCLTSKNVAKLFYKFYFPKSLTNSEKISVLLTLAHFKSNFAFPHPSPRMKLCSSPTLPVLYCSLFHCCVTLSKEKLPVEEELHISVPICIGRSIWPCLSICFWCKLVTEKLVGVICDNVNNKMQYSCLQAVERKACNVLYVFRTRTVVKEFSFFLARTLWVLMHWLCWVWR